MSNIYREHLEERASGSYGVVIPCFNYGKYLADAIESALAQIVPPQQIVIVDDGSTDDTAAVADRYADQVRYHHNPNSGVSAARNTGAAMLTTEYVVFLDADDRLHPEFAKACLAALADQPPGHYVYTDMQFFGATSEVFEAGEYSVRRLARSNFINPSAMLPLELVTKYGYREHLTFGLEDWDLYLTLADHGHTGVYVPQPLFFYRQHELGRTRNLRQHPFGLAKLRIQLARDHAGLYSRVDTAGYLLHVISQLRLDLGLGERLRRNLTTPGRIQRVHRKALGMLRRS
jgi:glycosyltransferase involved in cell wall biosynthesis